MCFPESVLWKTQLWVQKASCLLCVPPWSTWSTGQATRLWKQNPFPCTKREPKLNVLNHRLLDRHPDLPKWQCSKGGNPLPSLSFFLPSHYSKVLLPWHPLYLLYIYILLIYNQPIYLSIYIYMGHLFFPSICSLQAKITFQWMPLLGHILSHRKHNHQWQCWKPSIWAAFTVFIL